MGKRIFGTLLLAISLLMLFGFLSSKPDVSAAALVLTIFVAIVVPAAAGAYLWWSTFAEGAALTARKDHLRRQTLEAELLRLAQRRGGKLTVVEAVAELAFDAGTVEEVLNDMAARGLADVEVSESGVLVYAFYDVRHLDEKAAAKGVLDA